MSEVIRGAAVKGLLYRKKLPVDMVVFSFNPKEWTYRKTNNVTSTAQRGNAFAKGAGGGGVAAVAGAAAAAAGVGGAQRRTSSRNTNTGSQQNPTLTMDIMLDDGRFEGGRTYADCQRLLRWMDMEEGSNMPPVVVFHWGHNQYFTGYFTSLGITYQLFNLEGLPIRAKVSVQMKEEPETASSQNPTSGGTAARRSRTLIAGDTLQSVAYREYGSAALWRPLAGVNGIDDPLRVAAGQVLYLPSLGELKRVG